MMKWTYLQTVSALFGRLQFMLRSILEEVYFVILQYLYLVFGRTLSEYVF